MITASNVKQYEDKLVWAIPTGNAARRNDSKYETLFLGKVTKVFVEVRSHEGSGSLHKLRICGGVKENLTLSKDNGNYGYIIFSTEWEAQDFLLKDRLCRKLGGMGISEWRQLDLEIVKAVAGLVLKGEDINDN